LFLPATLDPEDPMTGHDDAVSAPTPAPAPAPAPAPVRLEPHPADERLAILRLDRPPVNAFSQPMWDLLDEAAASLHAPETAYRAVVITGGDRHFAAGADVKGLLDLTPEQFGARNRVLQRAFHALATAPQVTIAAVRGYALGGGCELALAADIRLAGRSATFGLPEVTLGIMPGSGGTQRLPRVIGPARAKAMILSGRMVGADEALAIGLADRVVEDAEVLDAAIADGLEYARGPLALRYAKQAVDAAADLPVEAGLALEADLITRCFASGDGQRGLRSFVADGPRKATFLGR
jgi:enoyl-CoA hydratase/carnithine racemase